jgi:hypothetical protein
MASDCLRPVTRTASSNPSPSVRLNLGCLEARITLSTPVWGSRLYQVLTYVSGYRGQGSGIGVLISTDISGMSLTHRHVNVCHYSNVCHTLPHLSGIGTKRFCASKQNWRANCHSYAGNEAAANGCYLVLFFFIYRTGSSGKASDLYLGDASSNLRVGHRRHELSSLARTLGSWVQIPLKAWIFGGCMRLFCVCFFLCLGRGLATDWSLVQGVLESVKNDYGTE